MTPILLSSDSFKNVPFGISPTDADSENRAPAPRILVVDDESLIADTIVQILNRNGFIA